MPRFRQLRQLEKEKPAGLGQRANKVSYSVEEKMPQNHPFRNSEDDEASSDTDKFAAFYLRRKCQVSLAHARVIADLLGCGGES
jgi:hypothetical protein